MNLRTRLDAHLLSKPIKPTPTNQQIYASSNKLPVKMPRSLSRHPASLRTLTSPPHVNVSELNGSTPNLLLQALWNFYFVPKIRCQSQAS
jgi:hypothetical protein